MNDAKKKELIEKTFSLQAVQEINSIILTKKPEIGLHYPNFPYDAPPGFNFQSRINAKIRANTSTKSKANQNNKVAEKLEPLTKRNSRYKGHYDEASLLEKASNNQLQVVKPEPQKAKTSKAAKKVSKPAPKSKINQGKDSAEKEKENTKPKVKVFTLSESSDSSDDESSNDKQHFEKLMEINEVPVVKAAVITNCKNERKAVIDSSSSDEYEPSNDSSHESPPRRSIKKQGTAKASDVSKKPKQPLASNLQLVKNAFNKNKDFNKSVTEFVKVFKEKEKELAKIPLQMPKIIPPPQEDPSKRVVKKKKKAVPQEPQHPDAHLGGIFTINNGWDKDIVEKEIEMPKVMVPREERSLPPVEIVTHDQEYSDEIDELDRNYLNNQISFEEEEEEQLDWYLDKPVEDNRPDTPLQLTHQNGSEELVINEEMPTPNSDESLNESVAQEMPTPNVDNSDESSNESEAQEKQDVNNNLQDDDGDDDQISIGAGCADLDDFLDGNEAQQNNAESVSNKPQAKNNDPMSFYTELEDFRLKIGVQKPKEVVPAPQEIKKIEVVGVDPETDEILHKVFGKICPTFLESRCEIPNCKRAHGWVSVESVRDFVMKCSQDLRLSTYLVLLRFSQLFKIYMPAFVEYAIKYGNINNLIELVRDCSRHQRTIQCLANIVHITCIRKYFNLRQAILFLIQYTEDGMAERDVILNLILGSGHLMSEFTFYIEKVFEKQMIPIPKFNAILENCNKWHQPALPFLCLNYLVTISGSQIHQVDEHNLKKFLEIQKRDISLNTNREAKLLNLAQKMRGNFSMQQE